MSKFYKEAERKKIRKKGRKRERNRKERNYSKPRGSSKQKTFYKDFQDLERSEERKKIEKGKNLLKYYLHLCPTSHYGRVELR